MDRTGSVRGIRFSTGQVYVQSNRPGHYSYVGGPGPVTLADILPIVEPLPTKDLSQVLSHLPIGHLESPATKLTITALAFAPADMEPTGDVLHVKDGLIRLLLTFTHCFDENASSPDTVALMLSVFSIILSMERTSVVAAGERSRQYTVEVQEVTHKDVGIHLGALQRLRELIAQDEFLDIDAYAKQHGDVRCPPWLRTVLPINMTTSYTEILMRNLTHSAPQFGPEIAFIMMGLAIIGDAKADVSPEVYRAYMEAHKEKLIAIFATARTGDDTNPSRGARYSDIVYPSHSFITMLKRHTSANGSIRRMAIGIVKGAHAAGGTFGVFGEYVLGIIRYSGMMAVSLVLKLMSKDTAEAFKMVGLAREVHFFHLILEKYGELNRETGKYVPNATFPYVGYLKLDGVENLSWRALGTLAGVALYMARLEDKGFNNVKCPEDVERKADSPMGNQFKRALLMAKYNTTDIATITQRIAKRLSTEVVAEDSINTCAKKRRL